VFLDALPLTPNGKIDRRALPAPDCAHREVEQGFVAPRTPIEAVLAEIWGEVLGVAQIGVDDDFFALGGHSLLATQVIARVRKIFQVEIPLRHLFEATTIAQLGQVIVAHETKPGQTEKIAELLQRIKRMSAVEVAEALGKTPQSKSNR
jgi:acyl carrier protein